MRAVIQRVVRASVEVDGATVGSIGGGLLILFAVEQGEDASDIDYLVSKIANLRIFNDEAGVMNRSLLDVGADALVVSQFTLFAQTRKGNRWTRNKVMFGTPEQGCRGCRIRCSVVLA